MRPFLQDIRAASSARSGSCRSREALRPVDWHKLLKGGKFNIQSTAYDNNISCVSVAAAVAVLLLLREIDEQR